MVIFTNRLLVVVCLLFARDGVCQVVQSVSSGFWDDPAVWDSGIVPVSSNSSEIIISSGHAIALRDNYNLDNLVISGGASLTVGSNAALHLENGPGTDLILNGSLTVDGSMVCHNGSTISATNRIEFHSGSVCRMLHTTTEGIIPDGDWHEKSTLVIEGYTTVATSSAAGNWGQSFGNVVWQTQSLNTVFDLEGRLTEVKGNLMVLSTGSGSLRLGTSGTMDIGGYLDIAGSSRVELATSSSTFMTVRIKSRFQLRDAALVTMATHGTGAFYIGGDMVIDGGVIRENGTGAGEFRFDASRRHRFLRGLTGMAGDFTGRLNYYVASDDTLDLGTSIVSNGTGSGNSNLFSVAGTLVVRSDDPNGALQNNTTGGNVRTTVSGRTFYPGSKVIFCADQPQRLVSSSATITRDVEIVIDNLQGVYVQSNLAVLADLRLKTGALAIGDLRTLTLAGRVACEQGYLDGLPTSTLVIADSLPHLLDLKFNPAVTKLLALTLDRRFTGAKSQVASPLEVTQLNIMNGTLISNAQLSLADNGTISRWPGGIIEGQRFSGRGKKYNVTYRSASGATGPFAKLTTGTELPESTEDDLATLNIQMAQGSDTVMLTQDIIIGKLIDMNRGRFYVQDFTIDFRGPVWSDDIGNFGYGKGKVIFSDTTVVQGSSNSAFNTVHVTPSAFVRFKRNTSVFGDIQFASSRVVVMDSVIMTLGGGAHQQLSASNTLVGAITISKSPGSTVTLVSPLRLNGVLRFGTSVANVEFRSNGLLILESATDDVAAAYGQGMVYRLQNGNTVSGDVTVKRFMKGEGRIFRYLSSPVQQSTVSSWMDDFPVTGKFMDPSPQQMICGMDVVPASPSLFYYDETKAAGYVSYPSTGQKSDQSVLEPGRGYAAFIRQCSAPIEVDVKGPLHQQQLSLPVTYTPFLEHAGWNLVGNPYPCTIDWDQGGVQGWTKTGISGTMAVRDNGSGGFFRYWDGDGEPDGIPGGRIAPFQGFWVRAISANPSLIIREGVKAAQGAEFFRTYRDTSSVLTIGLQHHAYEDKTFVKRKSLSGFGFDDFDCPKLDNDLFDLATVSDDGVPLAINTVPRVMCMDTLSLHLDDMEAGIYKITLSSSGSFSTKRFVLHDHYRREDITLSESYEFTVDGDPASASADRFTIRWEPLETTADVVSQSLILCDRQELTISIRAPAPGARYELWERDTMHVSNSLRLSSNMLDTGMHEIQVMQRSACRIVLLPGKVVVNRVSIQSPPAWSEPDCLSNTLVLKALPREKGSEVYWYKEHDDKIPFKTGTQVELNNLTVPRYLYVSEKSATGCESDRAKVRAPVFQREPLMISRAGDVLWSSIDNRNQWYVNGAQQEDTTNYFFIREPGEYELRNSAHGCEQRVRINIGCTESQRFIVHPNPVGSTLTVEGDYRNVSGIELIDGRGVLYLRMRIPDDRNQKIGIFDVSMIPEGFYLLKINTSGGASATVGIVKD